MKTSTRQATVGRPADKTQLIVASLRSAIVSGTMVPGDRIPSRVEMESAYQASSATVQRALSQLSRDGFVRVDQTRGTYVSSTPPHLTRYALVFPRLTYERGRNRMFQSLLDAAESLREVSGTDINCYEVLTESTSPEVYRQLVGEILGHRLAGLILVAITPEWSGTPILDEPGMCRVVIGSRSTYQMPSVKYNDDLLKHKAVAHLKALGCKRVACLFGSQFVREDLPQVISELGMETRPYWLLSVHQGQPFAATSVVHLLMNSDQRVRPDGLVIFDDNLLDHSLQGLLVAGVTIGRDVKVVAHSNFPTTSATMFPITRIGFETVEVVRRCIAMIDELRNDRPAMDSTIDPVFENAVPHLCARSADRMFERVAL